MPDITLCTNKECPSKDKCYRATAPVTESVCQSFAFFPHNLKKGKCDYFINNKKNEKNEN